jgi:hypothetical protein
MKVKGGHQLGETAAQFFAEGHEKQEFSYCGAGDFKNVDPSSKSQAKRYCAELSEARQQATAGKRCQYQTAADLTDMRTDTYTFDSGYLAKVELLYSAPNAESNYHGHTFDDLLAGVKQAYGTPTTESNKPTQDAYGVQYTAHHELWLSPQAAVLITDKPGREGTTTVVAFTRAEYDRTMAAVAAKSANPLE